MLLSVCHAHIGSEADPSPSLPNPLVQWLPRLVVSLPCLAPHLEAAEPCLQPRHMDHPCQGVKGPCPHVVLELCLQLVAHAGVARP